MKTKKYIIAASLISLTLAMTGILSLDNISVSAEEQTTNTTYTLQEVTSDLFGEKEISQSGYLYNLDGAADYVYVCFETGGYAILYEDTLELMEYAQAGNIPYQSNNGEKYYAGPGNYYQGTATQLRNTITGESLSLSATERVAFSQNLRTQLSLERSNVELQTESVLAQNGGGAEVASAPPIDTGNLIPADTNAVYIANKDFFIDNTSYGLNQHNTCGSVAAQLLLTYHNYYSDRRIIEPYYLNGGWIHEEEVDGFDIFDRNNYTNPDENPNVCNNPVALTEMTKGSNDDFYHHIIEAVEPDGNNCQDTIIDNGDGTFTRQHSHNGSTYQMLGTGLLTILIERLGLTGFVFKSGESAVEMISHIGNNRPIIISINTEQVNSKSFDHWVVGYGVQYYTYPGTTTQYVGFIVNCGWSNDEDSTNIWMNSAWCTKYLMISINHTHSYQLIEGIIENFYKEYRCTVCGHRRADVISTNMTTTALSETEVRLDGIGGTLSGVLRIPSEINGKTVVSIKAGAFASQTGITEVYLPKSVITIGNDAFTGCSNLQSVEGLGVASIGARAFKNCGNLQTANFSSSLVTIYTEAFAGDERLQSFLFNDREGRPSNLRTIFTSAFDGCTSLYCFGEMEEALVLPSSLETVGSGAFYGTNFKSITIGENVESIGSRAFSNMYSLRWIDVEIGNTQYFTSGGVLYDTRGYLLQYALDKTGWSFNVPTSVNGIAIKYIDDEAFMGAQNLVSVNLGNVEHIRARAFANSSNLISVTYTGEDLPSIGTGVFNGVADSFAFYCAEELIEGVTETDAWYAYLSVMEPIE